MTSVSAGGLCYGYRVVKALNGRTVTTGEREIEPAEATVVEGIFREFVAGVSPKQIAKNVNREAVPGPIGGAWMSGCSSRSQIASPPQDASLQSLVAAWEAGIPGWFRETKMPAVSPKVLRDTLILAACAEAGVEILYSEDLPGFDDFGGVRVVNPFK